VSKEKDGLFGKKILFYFYTFTIGEVEEIEVNSR
jgi:hypothetical protein